MYQLLNQSTPPTRVGDGKVPDKSQLMSKKEITQQCAFLLRDIQPNNTNLATVPTPVERFIFRCCDVGKLHLVLFGDMVTGTAFEQVDEMTGDSSFFEVKLATRAAYK
ncbi:hypothetical protein NQ317_006845 [Molorchus minor]|uniref:Uncharacterized protein n=1 Tax=Molorchus minor TaxID=1323400 RepID=A0ABQ9K1Q5_9CUCU|nr:hypothetical protein NQ317_006845 [Molorchus minor]